MDERDIVERAKAWLNEPSHIVRDQTAHVIIRALRHDLTRAREAQGELLAKSNEDDLIIDCYKKAEARWADSEAAYELLISTTQAELADARKEAAEWKHANGNLHRWAEGLEEGLSNLRARVVELKVLLEVCADPDEYDAAHHALSNLVKEVESGT